MNLINSTAPSAVIALNPAARDQQATLLRSAALVTQCNDSNEAETLVRLGRDLKAAIDAAAASRVEVTAPVLALQRNINAIAKTYSAPLLLEKMRLGKLHAEFTEREAARVAEEKRQRDAEVRRLEEEARVTELNRIAQAAALTDEASLTRAINAEEAAKEAAADAHAAIVAPLPSSERQRGTVVKRVFDVEVHDIAKLYAARPDLCTLALSKSALNAVAYEGLILPGVTLNWRTESSFRA